MAGQGPKISLPFISEALQGIRDLKAEAKSLSAEARNINTLITEAKKNNQIIRPELVARSREIAVLQAKNKEATVQIHESKAAVKDLKLMKSMFGMQVARDVMSGQFSAQDALYALSDPHMAKRITKFGKRAGSIAGRMFGAGAGRAVGGMGGIMAGVGNYIPELMVGHMAVEQIKKSIDEVLEDRNIQKKFIHMRGRNQMTAEEFKRFVQTTDAPLWRYLTGSGGARAAAEEFEQTRKLGQRLAQCCVIKRHGKPVSKLVE